MHASRSMVLAAAACLSLATTLVGQVFEDAQLSGLDQAPDDAFGFSVALSGELAVVGAHRADAAGIDSGAVYVFRDRGEGWLQDDVLVASDAQPFDVFGASVSLWERTALVGAYGDDDGGSFSGAAYVFQWSGAGWTETIKLVPGDSSAGARFGQAVSVFGDAALVGAWGDDESGQDAGAAYVFRLTDDGWTEEAKLLASDGATGDAFGIACALGDGVAFVGSFGSEAAYVFRHEGGRWVEEQALVAGGAQAGDGFGSAVALHGEVALVGAPRDDTTASDAGAAYVFRREGARWVQEQQLLASDGGPIDRFGDAVAIADDLILVGAWLAGPTPVDEFGAAYAFRWNGTAWVETSHPAPSVSEQQGGFGRSVALSGQRALVGALPFTDAGPTSGTAYVHTLPTPWSDLGDGLPGTDGVTPRLTGLGTLTPGSSNQVVLSDALPGAVTNIVVGVSTLAAPFKGGVLVPAPDVVLLGLEVDPAGVSTLPFLWPLGAAGVTVIAQHWVADPAGPAGFAASNGLQCEAP